MIRNVHEREIAAPVDEVGMLLDSLSSEHDKLWPRGDWPAMRFDRPLGVGAAGGHGPVRYTVDAYEQGRSVVFRFTRPRGFEGGHSFVVERQGETSATIRHELWLTPRGRSRITWPLFFRHLHDSLVEESFDRAERALGVEPRVRSRRTVWVRMLRLSFPAHLRRGRAD